MTGSEVAAEALSDWDGFLSQCVKVMPVDYKRVLQEQQQKAVVAG